MKFHGIQLQEGSSVKNMTVDSGTTFPDEPNNGELFFLTSADEAVMFTLVETRFLLKLPLTQ
jgi:hypothetical protein